ncbi:MAG: ATP-binding protein [Bacteroidota bacterium]|nr:ATP-binding protein [Bacteroidota bacterium]
MIQTSTQENLVSDDLEIRQLKDKIKKLESKLAEKRKVEQLQTALYNISNAVNKSKDLKDLLQEIRDTLSPIIDTSNFYVAMYDKARDMISIPYMQDANDNFEYFPAGKTLSGYVIKTARSLFADQAMFKQLKRNGEIELVGTDSKIWLGVPLVTSSGEAIGMIGIQSYEDENAYCRKDMELLEFLSNQICITIERKLYEDAIQLEKSYFEQLFEFSPEALVVTDCHGTLLKANQEFYNMFAFQPEESLGLNLVDLIIPVHLKKEAASIKRKILNGEKIKVETMMKRKGGSLFDVSILSSPIYKNGKINGNYEIYRDITDQKVAELKLREAKEKAEEADRLKTAFLSNMSHEIRTPLNSILGFTDLLFSQDLSKEVKNEYKEIIANSGRNLLNLIEDIIDVSKIEVGQLRIYNSNCYLNKLMKELKVLFDEEIKRKQKKEVKLILKNGCGDEQFNIVSDPFRLRQIILNLLGNSLKFTDRGFIEFGYMIENNVPNPVLKFYVKDTGIGIPLEQQSFIFERFRQADNQNHYINHGTGLGLTISKGLVELLGGRIWLKSEPAAGSTFYFTIPLRQKTE